MIEKLGEQCDIRYGYLAYVNDCHMGDFDFHFMMLMMFYLMCFTGHYKLWNEVMFWFKHKLRATMFTSRGL